MPVRRFAVCAFFRNEARYLPEWLAYHRAVGFEHFVLYDNNSTDASKDAVRQSPFADRATLVHWPLPGAKLAAYRHFADIFAPRSNGLPSLT